MHRTLSAHSLMGREDRASGSLTIITLHFAGDLTCSPLPGLRTYLSRALIRVLQPRLSPHISLPISPCVPIFTLASPICTPSSILLPTFPAPSPSLKGGPPS